MINSKVETTSSQLLYILGNKDIYWAICKQIYDMVNDGGVNFNFASFYFANYTLLTLQLKVLKVFLSACVINVNHIGSFAINRSAIVMTTTAKDNYSSMGNPSGSMAMLSS